MLISWTGMHLIWLSVWAVIAVSLYRFTGWRWMAMPWLPLSIVATAVAFYVGFKNNSAYDRMWESRKIWGAITNDSRTWGICVKAYLSNLFTEQKYSDKELYEMKRGLIIRHIAWLYQLRNQLLAVAPWEHANQGGHYGKLAEKYRGLGIGLYQDEAAETELDRYLDDDERRQLLKKSNPAVQLIAVQSEYLADLRSKGVIEDFRHMELQNLLRSFYEHQGKAERIKKYPLPRQYANMSFNFIAILIFLLPFGMVGEMSKLGEWGVWMSIPFTVLIGWIYVTMELVGDYSENPFQGMSNDTPMLSICRNIEIDLLEMLGDEKVPKPIPMKNGVLV